ncbi:MAG: naringenin-chalcone synthase [Chlamydiae bacterium]|nr:naringenin-chalcone synthase [Chlamydiota bacterium]
MTCISHFHSIRPSFETEQEATLEWLIDAHTQSALTSGMEENEFSQFREKIHDTLWKVCCKPGQIEKRGHVITDFLHRDWDQMEIYQLDEFATGKAISERLKCFEKETDLIFDAFYPENTSSPDDLIHVSCTGYVSPSSAQKLVSKRKWGDRTTVTHAYHMGCFGAFPAVRMGSGFLQNGKSHVDVVHTEICSLHINPHHHAPDQLVSQSLFADGFMKYRLSKNSSEPHFKILALQEEIIEDSSKSMTWSVSDFGFQMSLSREIPVHIRRAIKPYLKRLCEKANVDESAISHFAIHPGGPKILQYAQEMLQLKESQLLHSMNVLKEFGNMSSATIPHVWEKMLQDEHVPNKSLIVSLAFGPGLSISGSIMRKICGC